MEVNGLRTAKGTLLSLN